MKKLFFLGVCLVALASSPVLAQTGGADVVVVRTHEGAGTAYIAITYGAGRTEMIKFDAGLSEKSNASAAEDYQKIVDKLYREGYSLKSTFTTYQGGAATLIFVKGQ